MNSPEQEVKTKLEMNETELSVKTKLKTLYPLPTGLAASLIRPDGTRSRNSIAWTTEPVLYPFFI